MTDFTLTVGFYIILLFKFKFFISEIVRKGSYLLKKIFCNVYMYAAMQHVLRVGVDGERKKCKWIY